MRRIIDQGPGPRRRLGEAVAGLLGAALAGLSALVALVIWHLVRRGRLIRERLAPPRPVHWPDPAERPTRSERHANDNELEDGNGNDRDQERDRGQSHDGAAPAS